MERMELKKKDGEIDGESWRAEAGSGDSAFPLEADRGELWVRAPQSFTRTEAFLTGGKNNVIAASCTTECSPPVNITGIGS